MTTIDSPTAVGSGNAATDKFKGAARSPPTRPRSASSAIATEALAGLQRPDPQARRHLPGVPGRSSSG